MHQRQLQVQERLLPTSRDFTSDLWSGVQAMCFHVSSLCFYYVWLITVVDERTGSIFSFCWREINFVIHRLISFDFSSLCLTFYHSTFRGFIPPLSHFISLFTFLMLLIFLPFYVFSLCSLFLSGSGFIILLIVAIKGKITDYTQM